MSLNGKKVVIIADNGFVEPELNYVQYRLLEAGAEVVVATLGKKTVQGGYGYPVQADVAISDLNPDDFDGMHTPGGWSPYELRVDQKTLDFVRKMYEQGKVIAAICRGVLLLTTAGIMQGKRATTWEDVVDDVKNAGVLFEDAPVIRDQNIITSREPDDLPKYMPMVIKALAEK
ncbi:type 1 glutamine amidotransferase domain-containing protein [Thermoproteota archaeon]